MLDARYIPLARSCVLSSTFGWQHGSSSDRFLLASAAIGVATLYLASAVASVVCPGSGAICARQSRSAISIQFQVIGVVITHSFIYI
ncbi:hypothetical protein F5Y11DRAFT_20478 [Daldinia sp. FL1419]|nr:hypothetical protein F5Y11DRAFT_20478 [Daldinia sp. FL1419]